MCEEAHDARREQARKKDVARCVQHAWEPSESIFDRIPSARDVDNWEHPSNWHGIHNRRTMSRKYKCESHPCANTIERTRIEHAQHGLRNSFVVHCAKQVATVNEIKDSCGSKRGVNREPLVEMNALSSFCESYQ